MYLVDTDICVQFLRNEAKVIQYLRQLEDLHLSSITVAELFFGIFNSTNKEKHFRALENFLAAFTILPVNFPIAFQFGKIKAHLKKQGNVIGDFDILNGATGITYGLTLLTRNLKHYSKIPSLHVDTI